MLEYFMSIQDAQTYLTNAEYRLITPDWFQSRDGLTDAYIKQRTAPLVDENQYPIKVDYFA